MFGFNGDVDSGSTPEDIWTVGGLIPFPAAADFVSIVSDSADDTLAGIGAQTLLVIGVDDTFNIITEIVDMDGLTPVLTTQQFLFVNRSAVASAGSTAGNVGLITYTIGADLCNAMAILGGQTQTAAIIIPNALVENTVPHFLHVLISVGRTPNVLATVSLVVNRNGVNVRTLDFPISSNGTNLDIKLQVPLIAIPGDKIRTVITEVSGNNTLVAAFVQISWFPE